MISSRVFIVVKYFLQFINNWQLEWPEAAQATLYTAEAHIKTKKSTEWSYFAQGIDFTKSNVKRRIYVTVLLKTDWIGGLFFNFSFILSPWLSNYRENKYTLLYDNDMDKYLVALSLPPQFSNEGTCNSTFGWKLPREEFNQPVNQTDSNW